MFDTEDSNIEIFKNHRTLQCGLSIAGILLHVFIIFRSTLISGVIPIHWQAIERKRIFLIKTIENIKKGEERGYSSDVAGNVEYSDPWAMDSLVDK